MGTPETKGNISTFMLIVSRYTWFNARYSQLIKQRAVKIIIRAPKEWPLGTRT